MRATFVVASHLLSLALAVYTTLTSGVPVEILLYAFLIDYILRLGTIKVLHAESAAARTGWVDTLAPYISRRPAPGQESHPVRDGEELEPSGWTVMGPLLFFRFLYDLWASLDALDTGGTVPDAAANPTVRRRSRSRR